MWVDLKRAVFDAEMRMYRFGVLELDRVTAALTESQSLVVKFATALLTCSRGRSSHNVMLYKATFNLPVVLRFGWSVRYFSSMVLQT